MKKQDWNAVLLALVVFISVAYWIPKIIHEVRLFW